MQTKSGQQAEFSQPKLAAGSRAVKISGDKSYNKSKKGTYDMNPAGHYSHKGGKY